jgi:hypothetical protein
MHDRELQARDGILCQGVPGHLRNLLFPPHGIIHGPPEKQANAIARNAIQLFCHPVGSILINLKEQS